MNTLGISYPLLGKKLPLTNSCLHQFRDTVPTSCTGDAHKSIMKTSMPKQSHPSGRQCIWTIAPDPLLFSPPNQGPTDLTASLLPSCKGHLNQRTGTPAKAGKGEECMTIKSPNMWHWIQHMRFLFFYFLEKCFFKQHEKVQGSKYLIIRDLKSVIPNTESKGHLYQKRLEPEQKCIYQSYFFLLSYLYIFSVFLKESLLSEIQSIEFVSIFQKEQKENAQDNPFRRFICSEGYPSRDAVGMGTSKNPIEKASLSQPIADE